MLRATCEEAKEAHRLMKQRGEKVGAKTFDLMLENFKKAKETKKLMKQSEEKVGAISSLTLEEN